MAENSEYRISELSDIHELWYDGKGACEGCPRRDCDHLTAPVYGYGDNPADVAIVAQAPGGDDVKDTTGSRIGNGRRTWQNYSDTGDSSATPTPRDGFQESNLDTIGNYEDDIAPIINAFEEAYQNLLDRSCRLYYTQHTKCNDINDVDWFDPKNDEGQDRCVSYLIPELEVVQPDIVLVMGGKPNNHLQRAMRDVGVETELPSSVTDTVFADGKKGTKVRTYESSSLDAEILPSFHYGFRGMGSMKRFTEVDGDKEYWKTLAQGAVEQIN